DQLIYGRHVLLRLGIYTTKVGGGWAPANRSGMVANPERLRQTRKRAWLRENRARAGLACANRIEAIYRLQSIACSLEPTYSEKARGSGVGPRARQTALGR